MRLRARRLWSAPATIGSIVAALLVLAVPPVSASTAGWRLSASFPPQNAHLASVACFSATGCVAVGWSTLPNGTGSIPIELRTTDGGALWVKVAVPDAAAKLVTVSCAGTVCVTAGNSSTALRSSDGGATWTAAALPSSFAGAVSVACPTPTACYAAGYTGTTVTSGLVARSGDGGATWTSEYSETTADLQALWCAAATVCFATGASVLATTDGTAWGPIGPPAGFPTVAACPTALACVGSSPAEGIVTSSDGGLTWKASDGSIAPTSIACASSSACVATDGATLAITTDGGATWAEQAPAYTADTLTAVACEPGADCQVVGIDTADAYPDRALLLGVTPSTQGIATEVAGDAVDVADGVSCATSAVCAVAGTDPYGDPVVLRTENGGATWTDLVLPPTFVQLDAVSCPTPTVCLAVGGDANGTGAVWRTTDAGATWAPARVPASVGEVVAVACVSATRCEAVGYLLNSWTAVLASTDGGATWTALPMPHTVTDLHAIACPVVARCVAVGGHGGTAVAFYSTTAGRTWRPAHLTGGLRPFDAVACVSALVCLAASEQHAGSASQGTVERTTDGGVTWAPVVVPAHVASVASIACAGPSRCVAVGQTRAAIDPAASAAISIATATAGRSWTIVPAPRRVWGLDAVACARGGACVAAGTGTYEPPLPPTGAVVLRLG